MPNKIVNKTKEFDKKELKSHDISALSHQTKRKLNLTPPFIITL